MSREELLDILRIIRAAGYDEKTGKRYTERQVEQLIFLFEENIPNKHGSDLLFYPTSCGLPRDPSLEEILEKAMQEE